MNLLQFSTWLQGLKGLQGLQNSMSYYTVMSDTNCKKGVKENKVDNCDGNFPMHNWTQKWFHRYQGGSITQIHEIKQIKTKRQN